MLGNGDVSNWQTATGALNTTQLMSPTGTTSKWSDNTINALGTEGYRLVGVYDGQEIGCAMSNPLVIMTMTCRLI